MRVGPTSTELSKKDLIIGVLALTLAVVMLKNRKGSQEKRKFRQPSPRVRAEIARRNHPPQASVSDFRKIPLDEPSIFIVPRSLNFIWEGKKRRWDIIEGFEATSCMLYHKELESLIFVRQFRPAVYNAKLRTKELWRHENVTEALAPSEGITLEFVAGLLDKSKPAAETCAEEVEEEAGYRISSSDLEYVGCYRRDVGVVGMASYAYYGEVSDAQKVSEGGGIEGEESITLEYVHVSDLLKLANSDDESRPTAPGLKWGIYWFLYHKAHHCYGGGEARL